MFTPQGFEEELLEEDRLAKRFAYFPWSVKSYHYKERVKCLQPIHANREGNLSYKLNAKKTKLL